MTRFVTFCVPPAGLRGAPFPIAACRAGSVGVVNGELERDSRVLLRELAAVAGRVATPYAIKLDVLDGTLCAALRGHARRGLAWLILDAVAVPGARQLIDELRSAGVRVLAEVTTPCWPGKPLEGAVDGVLVKGNEAGGFVGEEASFILVQKWLGQTRLALYVRGGVTPHSAAACAALGVAGGVLDSQLLLFDELGLTTTLTPLLKNLAGSETVAVGDGERGEYFRILVRPGNPVAREFVASGAEDDAAGLRSRIGQHLDWSRPQRALLPIGQDVAFAADWRHRFGTLHRVVAAIDAAVAEHPRMATAARSIVEHAPLAEALGLRYPLVQGPMTRVSDTAEFALAIASNGALPMLALALLKGEHLDRLLADTAHRLQGHRWGIGMLGFAPQELLDEQLRVAVKYRPDYAIIAGGRPDQAVHLEQHGVPTFLHVPAARLIPMFLQEGARRFIFEGRECGGHIGPLSSFVLWSAMVDALVAELDGGRYDPAEIQLLFAGGIHDAASSAMMQVLTAPLAARHVRIGILMGSAYLFTREIVAAGSIVPQFQREVLACERTIALESGPGHASRCAYTPFAAEYFRKRAELRRSKVAGDAARQELDRLILGRLRIASKGVAHAGPDGAMESLDEARQQAEGMYMLGQVATLRHARTDVATLHREVTSGAATLLDARAVAVAAPVRPADTRAAPQPADVAIVGMACVLPRAGSLADYWENILDGVDAITEVPARRWDWRLYFDSDRTAKDKIYSKWGGFLDDVLFDPTRYGMPPKSIESVDPMQLMALEVARRALDDAGYGDRPFDRERASCIIGASGGAGDVGMQYGLRSELPRFTGALPAAVAERLPQWTEDSFAGILLNVVAGRIANRLDFGGTNFVTDAACASSLAAVYQGVSELVAGRSDMVLAGGVDTVQGPFGYLCFSKTQALSPRGRCATFSASGDGIVISEGIAMLVLKRLADAERDGDRVYAVIKGVGGSSDGRGRGLTAPLPAGQLRAMRRAYAQAGFAPHTVGLFEAHGTGTVAGDTAELESTTALIGDDGGTPHQSVIGSVKTMIGHTKAAAGVAGLIKASLALHRRTLPPQRTDGVPNRVLCDAGSPLYLLDEPRPWLAAPDGSPRRAGVSAFGFGGTDFHIVLEEYAGEYRDWLRPAAHRDWPVELLLWSAGDRAGLIRAVRHTRDQLDDLDGVALRHVAASLAHAFDAAGEALAIVAPDVRALAALIDAALAWLEGRAGALPPHALHGAAGDGHRKVALLFPGQGSQYVDMLREEAVCFPVCADTLAAADVALAGTFTERYGKGSRLSGFILPRGAYDDAARKRASAALTGTDIAQPALGAAEVAWLRLLLELGLTYDMTAGHSYGEFVALHAAGAIDFDTLMRLSAIRGEAIVDAARAGGTELGTMAAVRAGRDAVAAAIAGIDDVVIANHNAPEQVVISGSDAAVAAAVDALAGVGIAAIPLHVAAAFHSVHVKPALAAFEEAIASAAWHAPVLPVYSNGDGRPHPGKVDKLKHAMALHLVRPVEFVAEVEAMYADGARVFVEVGPKAVLSKLTDRILDGRPHVAVAVNHGHGLADFVGAVAQLLCAGVRLDVAALFRGRDCQVVDSGRLATLKPAPVVSRTAWLLNGGAARRATDPPRQIGVTLEDLAKASPPARAVVGLRPIALTDGPHPDAPTYAPDTPMAQPASIDTFHPLSQRVRATTEAPVNEFDSADAAVMSEYFQTMRQFLDAQSQVMAAFMGAAAPQRAAAFAPRMAPPRRIASPGAQRQPEVAAPPAHGSAAAPAPSATAPGRRHQAPEAVDGIRLNGVAHVAPAAARRTGPVEPQARGAARADDAPHANGVQANGAVKPPPHATNGAARITDRARLGELLLGIVEEKTGYPRDMVKLDQNLEADLGIDSIKRIEVVGAMLQALPEPQREALKPQRSKLNTQATLSGMLDLLAADAPAAA